MYVAYHRPNHINHRAFLVGSRWEGDITEVAYQTTHPQSRLHNSKRY